MATTHFRTCPLCEATCGLEITFDGDKVERVKGDKDDVFSRGFICPKGTAVKHLHEDPDRLKTPMVREGADWRAVNWDEAFSVVERGLGPIIKEHGKDAVALYVGNPSVHSLSVTVLTPALVRALGSKNFYSAASVDQMPKHASCGFMFGSPTLIPVPDIDRAHYLIVLGANPWVSNGSLATAPDFRGRLEAISGRGGKVVVIDPRRTETARGADEYVPIRPGTDALFLLAMAHVLFEEGRVSLGHLEPHVNGLDEVQHVVAAFSPEAVSSRTGIPAETIRRIAREFADAPAGSVYDRVGAHQQTFGTLTSWASDVLNVITGNLDRPGGRMFPLAAHSHPDPESPSRRGWRTGRFKSRVRGFPEVFGQLPIAVLAEEIETPGDGRVRAFISLAGNPVLSTPNGDGLGRALSSLDFMVSVDPYLNETTRFANVILPPSSILSRHHYDFAFYALSVRNIANYSPPMVAADGPDEWEILSRLALVCAGESASTDPSVVPQMALAFLVQKATEAGGSLDGRSTEDIMSALGSRGPVEKILDFRLRSGPFGDLFGERPDGLSLEVLEANPHGVDLGPLTSRIPNALRTASGKIELAPREVMDDIPRLQQDMASSSNDLVLIGRRQLRSNNSWMHNLPTMMRGSNRCTLMVNPEDAARLGLEDGATARMTSRVGTVEAQVEVTDDVISGVVCLPHGWGHDVPGTRMSVARANAGVSSNDVTDEQVIDPLSGNAVLNGVPVTVEPATVPVDERIPSRVGPQGRY